MMFWRAAITALFTVCISASAVGQDIQSEATQRQQIQQQRQQVEADGAKRQLACRDQFVVTSCLEKARVDKQEALHLLRERELAMDAAKREQRVAEQAARVADKAQTAASRQAQASASATREEAPPKPQKPARKASSLDKNKLRAPSPAASHSAAEEQHKREQFNARQREAQAHREAVEQRNAKRSKQQTAKPLPVPADASGAGR